MKKDHDFSKVERGRFYYPDVELNIPVYLDADVAKVVRERAEKRDIGIDTVVNDWIRQGIRVESRTRRVRLR